MSHTSLTEGGLRMPLGSARLYGASGYAVEQGVLQASKLAV